MKSRPRKGNSYRLSVDYRYDLHSIEVSASAWKKILSGQPIRLSGAGYHCEGKVEDDYWIFNTKSVGYIYVGSTTGTKLYEGNIADAEVHVYGPQGQRASIDCIETTAIKVGVTAR